jgi:hypothetical protein
MIRGILDTVSIFFPSKERVVKQEEALGNGFVFCWLIGTAISKLVLFD